MLTEQVAWVSLARLIPIVPDRKVVLTTSAKMAPIAWDLLVRQTLIAEMGKLVATELASTRTKNALPVM